MSTGPDHPHRVEEQLSAWLDDELPGPELELLASRLMRSPEQRARVARYGLIGSALRGGSGGARSVGLAALQISSRVNTALDATAIPDHAAKRLWASRILPYAIAAGLALLAVVLVPILQPPLESGATFTAGVAVQPAIEPAVVTPTRAEAVVTAPVPGQPSLSSRRLTSYLVYHGEYSGMLSAKLTDSHIVTNRAYAVAVSVPEQPPGE